MRYQSQLAVNSRNMRADGMVMVEFQFGRHCTDLQHVLTIYVSHQGSRALSELGSAVAWMHAGTFEGCADRVAERVVPIEHGTWWVTYPFTLELPFQSRVAKK